MTDILALYRSGLSCKAIAKQTGEPLRKVRRIVKEAGITRPPNGWSIKEPLPDERPLIIELPKAGKRIVSVYPQPPQWFSNVPNGRGK